MSFSNPEPNSTVFQAIFESSPVPMWILNSQGVIVEINSAALDIIQVPEAFVRGRSFTGVSWFTTPQAASIQASLEECLRLDQSLTHALQPLPEPNLDWMELSFRPFTRADEKWVLVSGRILTSSGAATQVALERSEIALQESRQELALSQQRLLSQHTSYVETQRITNSASWRWQKDTNHFEWSGNLATIFGLEGATAPIALSTFLDGIHPEDAELFYEGFSQLPSKDFYIRILRPGGEVRYLYGIWHVERNADDEIAVAHGTCQDVTYQHMLGENLVQKAHQVSTLNAIAQLIASSDIELDIYSHVIAVLQNLIGAQSMAVFLQDPAQLMVQHHGQPYAIALEPAPVDAFPEIEQVWQTGMSLSLPAIEANAIHTDDRFFEIFGYSPRSLIIVPLWWRAAHIGVLVVSHPHARHFGQDDTALVQTVGVWLTIALLNQQMMEEQRVARYAAEQQRAQVEFLMRTLVNAQEAERQRIARELHDETGQALVVVKMQLNAVKNLQEEAERQASIKEAMQLTSDTMENIRRLAYNLLPPSLNKVGLSDSLQGLCRDYMRRTRLDITYTASSLPPLSQEIILTLYRFVQEALTNITKYAQAQTVVVSTSHDGQILTITVTDDGQGFDTAITQQGMGLTGMQGRLQLVGGVIEIYSTLGKGTTLVAQVPITNS